MKWVLRRADHAAIYLLIAATYTPFLVNIQDHWHRGLMMAIVWGGARRRHGGEALLPGRFDGLAIAFYLAIGWSGLR